MNKEYIYIDGKAVIEDEKGKKKVVKHYDNIDEVLIQENLIEQLENEIIKLKDETSYTKKNNFLGKTFLISFILMFLFVSLGIFLSNNILNILTPSSLLSCKTILILDFTLICFVSSIQRNNKKTMIAELNQLEFLKSKLEFEKNKLNNIKKINNKSKQETFYVKQIDDKEMLKKLKKELQLHYICSYNEKKYNKYYNNNKLKDKLEDKYSKEDIELIENYLEKDKQKTKKY